MGKSLEDDGSGEKDVWENQRFRGAATVARAQKRARCENPRVASMPRWKKARSSGAAGVQTGKSEEPITLGRDKAKNEKIQVFVLLQDVQVSSTIGFSLTMLQD